MATRPAPPKLWGGRFAGTVDPAIHRFTASLPFDRRLVRHDLVGSLAHARMLRETGALDEPAADAILAGLSEILAEVERGGLDVSGEDEDVHSWIERELFRRIGDNAGALPTARSRNDQTSTALRLFVRESLEATVAALVALQEELLGQARSHRETWMPGYTHLQRGQPVSLAHHLLAHFWSLSADRRRFELVHRAAGVSPLGAGALAGTPHCDRSPPDVAAARLRGRLRQQHPCRRRSRLRRGGGLRVCARLGPPLALGRGGRAVDVVRVRLRRSRRFRGEGFEPHAPEEERGAGGAGSRESGPGDRRPDSPLCGPEGIAARVRQRPPGGQGGRLRRPRHDAGLPRGRATRRREPGVRPEAARRALSRPGTRRRRTSRTTSSGRVFPSGARTSRRGARSSKPTAGAAPSRIFRPT